MAEFYDLNGFPQDAISKKLGWTRVVEPAFIESKSVQQEARKVRQDAEVVIARGSDKINRLASECWEVDMIGSPELHGEKDFMHQSNSGIDYVIARACAERGIAVELNFSNALNSRGRKRTEIMARMAQNVRICRDTGCGAVITSGARDEHGLRAPRDLMAFGILLGMSPEEARATVSENPERIIGRHRDRTDPDIILKGLRVEKWGSEPREKKRICGWYW